MYFYSIIGTRPNFVKEFLINRECRKRGIVEIVVHTGQHYDYEMSQVFFDGFNLPKPDHYLGVENITSTQFTAEVILRLDKLLRQNRPDFILSYGDVNSTLSAAVASAKNHIPFVHVEGGVRGHDLYNPEEINRRVADVLAAVNYCCTKTDVVNLKNENYELSRICLTGDLMYDALKYTMENHAIKVARGDYMVLTLHRQENILDGSRLTAIFEGLMKSNKRIVFPVHPHTLKQLNTNGLINRLSNSNIELVKPMGYLEFLRLLAGSDKVLTDSGGVRREAYLLKKPCIVLIELSWFPEISQAGWKVLTAPDVDGIANLVRTFEPHGEHRPIFGNGDAYLNIINDLEARYGY